MQTILAERLSVVFESPAPIAMSKKAFEREASSLTVTVPSFSDELYVLGVFL